MSVLLNVSNLRAGYGDARVLHGVSFTIVEGGVTTLLGANGAGKTTTLRALSRMINASGEVSFAGQRIDRRSTEDIVRLGIAHLPEGRGTFTRLTIEENLHLGAITRGDRATIATDRAHLSILSNSEGASRPAGRNPLRGRATNAGACPRHDASSSTPSAG